MKATETTEEHTQYQIELLRNKMENHGFKKIIPLLEGPRTPEPMYIMEPEHPIVVGQTAGYQLMQHSFSSMDEQGTIHDIALRDDEFLLLHLLHKRGPSGAATKEINKMFLEAAVNTKGARNAISSINTRLRRTRVSIASRVGTGRPGHYAIIDRSAP